MLEAVVKRGGEKPQPIPTKDVRLGSSRALGRFSFHHQSGWISVQGRMASNVEPNW